jgi:hypothetical protein
MTWLALVLIGFGLADLGHSAHPVRRVPECAAAVVVVVIGLLAGLTGAGELIGVLAAAAATIVWGWAVRFGFGRRRPWVPLLVLGVAVVGALFASAWPGHAGGWLGDWLGRGGIPVLQGVSTQRALLLLGGLLVQGSTGNVLVRLILLSTHSINPARAEAREPGPALKGGRLLGPMERLVIVGLGLAGDYTAAGIVVAAKGLLRFPELQAARDRDPGPAGKRIAQVTEYFLVGSFVSWLVALGTLVVLAR